MAIIDRKDAGRRQIDLKGPDGNAYALLGMASGWLKQLGYSQEDRSAILKDMKSDDYEHLIKVFDREFGYFVDLIR